MEWVKFALTCILILIYSAYLVKLYIEDEREEEKEDADFERRRAIRKEYFDRHAQAVARKCLIDTCESICLGNYRYKEEDSKCG